MICEPNLSTFPLVDDLDHPRPVFHRKGTSHESDAPAPSRSRSSRLVAPPDRDQPERSSSEFLTMVKNRPTMEVE
jgi:hypothetical protein